jgi:L,D-peptidoglycan transpeptidase YkuD (ErfK/YbiS/YcfS/YnhG family)
MVDLVVTADAPGATRGTARLGKLAWPCALGRGGILRDKREGDGGTPAGRFPWRQVFYRPDRLQRPATPLPCRPITPADGWCDDPNDPANYNRLVRLPYGGSHERLWRPDHLYDVILVPGHNDSPPVPGLGSAIFVHVATPDYAPTAGCVALRLEHLLVLLCKLDPDGGLVVEP